VAERTWTCTRRSDGHQCGAENRRRYRKCQTCGKPRPPHIGRPTKATHIKGTYEEYVERQGGEFCLICGRTPDDIGPSGKPVELHRDHDHTRGIDRGLLCIYHNRKLGPHITLEWARAVVAYLERYE
jgi:hypothetical protein